MSFTVNNSVISVINVIETTFNGVTFFFIINYKTMKSLKL